ncbi:MAG: glycosyltransferase [Actinobacteria bacterium]|uniref:Unannotated protein n=1 Tax=freshwater metagenome TaxID=449393 RepID=A0A6J5Z5N3_9ZZZZ|nr:glycosyltransferase [Actinomycetota bacterium]
MSTAAAIIIPTRGRPQYLDRALRSIVPQATTAGVEVIVVDDGPSVATRTIAEGYGARYIAEGAGDGLNAARNRGIEATRASLLIFVDDDVEVEQGWLSAILDGAKRNPTEVGVLTGPIRPLIEGHRFRACGRDGWPITGTNLGSEEADCRYAWGANMAIRREVFEGVGLFDPTIGGGYDETELQDRWAAAGGRVRYLPGAALNHIRFGDDARLGALCSAQRSRGRTARRHAEAVGAAPTIGAEIRTLLGCLWHGPRRFCSMGPVNAAHSLGRIEAAISKRPPDSAPLIAGVNDFLSGSSGEVSGRRARLMALADRGIDLREARSRSALDRAASAMPTRRVLVLTIASGREGSLLEQQRRELERSKHDLALRVGEVGSAGKFENVNRLLAAEDSDSFDWVILLDDDVELPGKFLDSFLYCAEQAKLEIAQPAHRLHSHAAWPITRRRSGLRSRRTTFVEIGPVTAFSRLAASELIPFPDLRMGWGLDAHWAAFAAKRGWPIGIVDATPIGHSLRAVAADYPRADAIAEAQRFLADRPYVTRDEVRTIGIKR